MCVMREPRRDFAAVLVRDVTQDVDAHYVRDLDFLHHHTNTEGRPRGDCGGCGGCGGCHC